MKWTLYPKNKNLTTTLPLYIEMEEWIGTPQVHVSGLGKLKLTRSGDKLRSEFYFTLPGTYKIEVRDNANYEAIELSVAEHRYLDFTNEFGSFLVLFLMVMGGIVFWTRKIMQK